MSFESYCEREYSDKYTGYTLDWYDQAHTKALEEGRISIRVALWFGMMDYLRDQELDTVPFHRNYVTHALYRGHFEAADLIARGCLGNFNWGENMVSQHINYAYISAIQHGQFELAEYLEGRSVNISDRIIWDNLTRGGYIGALRYLQTRGSAPKHAASNGKDLAEYYGYPKCLEFFKEME